MTGPGTDEEEYPRCAQCGADVTCVDHFAEWRYAAGIAYTAIRLCDDCAKQLADGSSIEGTK